MNYEYSGVMFYEITFPTRDVQVALIRPDDIKRIKEKINKTTSKIVTEIVITRSNGTEGVFYYDGELEDFKKHCKKVYL